MSEEPGQEQPALEDQQPSADQDDVLATDIQSEQIGDSNEEAEFEPTEPIADAEPVADAGVVADAVESALDIEGLPEPEPALVRTVEALLFLAPDPLSPQELSDAADADELVVIAALAELAERYAPGHSGIHLRELGGGFTFASDPETEDAARRLFSRPRASVLTPAQAETLAIVAYLQPISRPEITRIRGVSADSAASTLLERGLVEESGRSQFGAVMYRTTTQFLKLFGLRSIEELPDVGQWDPSPEEQAELRERLLRAGEARAGGGPQPELQ
jgi:segregation and condensation protein B